MLLLLSMVIDWFTVWFALVSLDMFVKGSLFNYLFGRFVPDVMMLGSINMVYGCIIWWDRLSIQFWFSPCYYVAVFRAHYCHCWVLSGLVAFSSFLSYVCCNFTDTGLYCDNHLRNNLLRCWNICCISCISSWCCWSLCLALVWSSAFCLSLSYWLSLYYVYFATLFIVVFTLLSSVFFHAIFFFNLLHSLSVCTWWFTSF